MAARGLGLFISRQLVEMQGGEIGVASEAGKGSIFQFYVKTRRTNQPEEIPQKTDLQLRGTRGCIERSVCGRDLGIAERDEDAEYPARECAPSFAGTPSTEDAAYSRR